MIMNAIRTASSDCALLRHPGQARAVEGVNQLLQSLQRDPRVALCQHVNPEQAHCYKGP